MQLTPIEWDDEPTPIKISLEPGDARLSAWGDHDTVVIRKIGEKRFEALVPTWSVAEDWLWVSAVRVGKIRDKIIVYLATSNEGRPEWRLTEEELEQVLVK